MKRILNASPPVRPATSRALGRLHDERDSKSAEDTHLPTALRAAWEAKSARQRMKLMQGMMFVQGKPGVLVSVEDCHSPRLARRSLPTAWPSTNERTNGWSEHKRALDGFDQ